MQNQKGFAPIFGFGALAFGIMTVIGLLGAVYTVDEGDRGVIVRFGVVQGVAEPGIHFKAPFITSIIHVPVRNQIQAYQGLEAYTTDQQIATIEEVNISYRIPADRVEEVYREFRTPEAVADRFVGRRVNSELEKVFGQYTAERSVRERAGLSADVSKALKDIPAGSPIEIVSVELVSIAYPPEYTQAINNRMGAEVEVAKRVQEVRQAEQDRLKQQQVADGEAYRRKSEADAEAHSIRVKAEADAYGIRERGNASAEAIRARSQALSSNPALVELTKAERWNGQLPTSMIPGNAVPFINVE